MSKFTDDEWLWTIERLGYTSPYEEKVMPVFSVLVDSKQILDFDLKGLDALRDSKRHPATVATQLSVLAWNHYEFKVYGDVGGDVRHPDFVAAVNKRGSMKSGFDFVDEGVLVSLIDEGEGDV